MKPKSYPLLSRCVEDGIQLGWNRTHKHDENPPQQMIFDEIHEAIMAEVCEWFEFLPASDLP